MLQKSLELGCMGGVVACIVAFCLGSNVGMFLSLLACGVMALGIALCSATNQPAKQNT